MQNSKKQRLLILDRMSTLDKSGEWMMKCFVMCVMPVLNK